MRARLFFEGEHRGERTSRFWLLLVLAAVIASAGVVADSTATVIGAMVVAPLMTPILGVSLAVALTDRVNLVRCLLMAVGGAVAVVAIGWLAGKLVVFDVVAATNTQVSSRVHPRLIDLVAALATGVVGAVAVNRDDIADALPGVAIAVSLVPPLAVVGLTLESGASKEAVGAAYLFLTNMAAILAAAIAVFALYGVFRATSGAVGQGGEGGRVVHRRRATLAIVGFLGAVAVPLLVGAVIVARDTSREADVADLADTWAEPAGWRVVDVTTSHADVVVRAQGPGEGPDPDDLRQAMDSHGLGEVSLQVELTPADVVELPGT